MQMVWYVLVPLVCLEGQADVALGMRNIIVSGGTSDYEAGRRAVDHV